MTYTSLYDLGPHNAKKYSYYITPHSHRPPNMLLLQGLCTVIPSAWNIPDTSVANTIACFKPAQILPSQ